MLFIEPVGWQPTPIELRVESIETKISSLVGRALVPVESMYGVAYPTKESRHEVPEEPA